MTSLLAETSPGTRGRLLAALYLYVIIAGITAQSFIGDRLVVRDDAARTAANILANTSLYRLGFTIFMLEMVAQVGVSLLFYELLKPVNRSVARASAILGLTGSGIKTLARLFHYAPDSAGSPSSGRRSAPGRSLGSRSWRSPQRSQRADGSSSAVWTT